MFLRVVGCSQNCFGTSAPSAQHLKTIRELLKFRKRCKRPSLGPLKGFMSAQKVLHGSENEKRELLEGIEENNILHKGQKVQTEKMR